MAEQASKQARKEERRKMKRCKADPDRQQYGRLPEVPAMNVSTGLHEHVPDTAPQSEMDSSSWLKKESMDTFEPLVPLPVPTQTMKPDQSQPSKPAKKSFFGADIDDSYADYVPDQKDYHLQPDFLGSFEQTGLQKASALPPSAGNMYWKPTAPSGAQTSFVENVAPSKYYHPKKDVSMEEVMKRMDMLFARLDDLNSTTPEQMTSELLMFISSGIFVLFMMDLLVKKGSTLRF